MIYLINNKRCENRFRSYSKSGPWPRSRSRSKKEAL